MNGDQQTQQVTPQELAKRIRTKYPKAYDKVPDDKLVEGFVKKYPQYKTRLSTGAPTQAPAAPKQAATPAPVQEKPPVDERVAQWAEENYGRKAYTKAPSWYGASAKYLAGEATGAGLAVYGAAKGSAQLGYDLLSSLSADINPFLSNEEYRAVQEKAGEDIKDAARGMAKIATDLLKADTYTDPIKFGGEVANIAMTVEGAKKMAESLSGKGGHAPNQVAKAVSTAGEHGLKEAILKPRAHAVAWSQLKGAELGKKFGAARKAVSDEYKAQFDNISQQIDTANPQGSVDAGPIGQDIIQKYGEIVKTPDKMNSALKALVDDAKRTQPGQWTFEKTKQFRSKAWQAMKEGDPQGAVLGKTVKLLGDKLQATASKYGLGDAWKNANELRTRISEYDDALLKSIRKAGIDGHDVMNALKSNKTMTARIATDLKKYGLDPKEVMSSVKLHEKIAKTMSSTSYRLFRYAYGAGIPVTLAVRMATKGGYLPAMAAGAATGIAAAYVTSLARALKLHPEVLRMLLDEKHLPGPSGLPKGKFPQAPPPAQPQLPGVPATPPQAPTPPSATAAPSAPAATPTPTLPQLPGVPLEAEAPKTPKVKKAAPGEHGTGRLAEQSKGRERADKGRATPGYERSKRAGERRAEQQAAMKAPSQAKIDMGQVTDKEMEQFLENANPVALSGLKKILKADKITGETYTQSLRHLTIEAYEKTLKGMHEEVEEPKE